MASNAQKTPLVSSLNDVAIKRAADAIQQLGKALPCHVLAVVGQIVTVAFDITSPTFTLPNVTIPVATSHYDWLPVQIGDKGVTFPADAYLGGVSGLGSGVANLSEPANLSALVFLPVSNAAWTVADPNMRVIKGPQGVMLTTLAGLGILSVTDSAISLSVAGQTLVVDATGVIINGRVFLLHEHSGVQSGPDITGPVV